MGNEVFMILLEISQFVLFENIIRMIKSMRVGNWGI